jgi:hypothetical protein
MSALGWAIGGWLFFNVVLVVALLNRRSMPAVREKLFQWVIGEQRLRYPSDQGELDESEYRSGANARDWGMIPAKVLGALVVIAFLVVGSVMFVSHHPSAMSACASNCD